MFLPEQFLDRLRLLLGEDYENYLAGFETTYGQTLRVNRLKVKPADLIRRFVLEQVPWCENGFYYDGEERLSLHPYYYAGLYYLQEPSAMAPAHFLPVVPGEKVLDLCAAPGGKTTALAAKLNGEGILIANDISASRCKALLKNMELAGVKNSVVVCETPEKLASHFPGYFDKILVDAPCSGEGMFRKEPSMAQDWSLSVVEKYAKIQKTILEAAHTMLKPGGMILYSTCTYSPEEDEQSVEYLLEKGYELVELPIFEGVAQGMPQMSQSGNQTLRYCRRFWNHRLKGEGQFAALLQKPGLEETTMDRPDSEYIIEQLKAEQTVSEYLTMKNPDSEFRNKNSEKRGKKQGKRKLKGSLTEKENAKTVTLPEEMEEFFADISWQIEKDRLMILDERVFLLPAGLPSMRGIRQIRSGLYLGDCKKKRFEPSQALAMALKPEEYPNVLSLPLKDERVDRYLKGESIDAPVRDGWVLICVDDFPLGWGKASGQRIKNKYHKGWRKS